MARLLVSSVLLQFKDDGRCPVYGGKSELLFFFLKGNRITGQSLPTLEISVLELKEEQLGTLPQTAVSL